MVKSSKGRERKHSDLKLPVINDPDSCWPFPRENWNLLKQKLKETEASTDFPEEVKIPGLGSLCVTIAH